MIGVNENVKEKIKAILNGEKTKKYLDNITKPLGDDTIRGNIISGKDAVNCFLLNIFRDEKAFVDREQNNNSICDLIVCGKRILTRTMSVSTNSFYFGCFSSDDNRNFNINRFVENARERINNTDYFLILVIDRSKPNELFRCCYNIYLKSAKDFTNDEGVIYHYKRSGGGMFLYVDKKALVEPIFTYSNVYE